MFMCSVTCRCDGDPACQPWQSERRSTQRRQQPGVPRLFPIGSACSRFRLRAGSARMPCAHPRRQWQRRRPGKSPEIRSNTRWVSVCLGIFLFSSFIPPSERRESDFGALATIVCIHLVRSSSLFLVDAPFHPSELSGRSSDVVFPV